MYCIFIGRFLFNILRKTHWAWNSRKTILGFVDWHVLRSILVMHLKFKSDFLLFCKITSGTACTSSFELHLSKHWEEIEQLLLLSQNSDSRIALLLHPLKARTFSTSYFTAMVNFMLEHLTFAWIYWSHFSTATVQYCLHIPEGHESKVCTDLIVPWLTVQLWKLWWCTPLQISLVFHSHKM